MRKHSKRTKLIVGVASALALAAGTFAATGVAEADPAAQGNTGWRCGDPNATDGWGITCTHKNGHRFGAFFQNSGGSGDQKLYVTDNFANNAPTVVRLTVSGSGTAVYTSSDDLDYTAGKKVTMEVCSSFSSGAACWDRGGTS